jgi:regulator of RNase E activity RraA
MGAHGVMHRDIKPLSPGMRVAGPALTVLTRPGDALFVVRGADCAQPGDVMVIDGGGVADMCVIGDRIAYYLQAKRKVNGIVVDAAVRDARGLREAGMPVFTRGVTPIVFGAQGPGAVNVPIACGGVPVKPGDIIVGDDDGVVVVPLEDATRVLALAEEHLAGELRRLAQVNQGMRLSDVQNIAERIARWQ